MVRVSTNVKIIILYINTSNLVKIAFPMKNKGL